MAEVLLARLDDLTASGIGAITSASNVGSVGVGVFKQKVGTDAEFYKLNAASARASIVLNGTDRIDFDVVEVNINIANTSGNLNPGRISPLTTDRLLGRDTAGSGAAEELTVGGGLEFTGTLGIQTSAFTGDVTKAAGGTAQTIANDAVTNAKLANMAQATIKGRQAAAGTGDPEDLTDVQARTAMGLGTAAVKNTGTSGDAVPLLNSANLNFTGPVGVGGAPAAQTFFTVASGSLRVFGADTNFGAGGNSTLLDFAGGYARVGGVNGGGANVGLQLISRNGIVAQADAGWQIGTPTGGDKGTGTANASGFYDDGVLLTALVAGTSAVLNPYATSSAVTQAHGLGVKPQLFDGYFECLTAEFGYAVGEKVPFGSMMNNGGSSLVQFTISADSTNVFIHTRSAGTPQVVDQGTNAAQNITAANWKIVVVPYKIV